MKYLLRLSSSIYLVLCASVTFIAQQPVVFIDRSETLSGRFSSDYSLIVADINGDYRDDILRQSTDAWSVAYQLESGDNFLEYASLSKPFTSLTSNVTDVNNDGLPEILMIGNKTGLSIIKTIYPGLYPGLFSQVDANIYAQGSAVADIDNDGWLDYFVSNDNGSNALFMNNRGVLSEINNVDFNVLEGSDAEGNYNLIFIDPDLDGDLDVYVTKCHVQANSFEDPRRINQFFENVNGHFEEAAEKWNLAHGDQSWCSAAADLDNDGDQDLFLINHGAPLSILRNDGQSFTRVNSFSNFGLITGDEQQVILEDFNNDGYVDIFIFGFNDQLLLNKGGLEFTTYPNPLGGLNAYSGACGDLNDDGWLDILAVYGTAGSATNDKLMLNFGGPNNFVKFSLAGIQSNALGIGARLELWAGDLKQTKWLNSGSSYGITNSLAIHFGLSDEQAIDSVRINWPSGHIDRYNDLDVNFHYIIAEGSCLVPRAKTELVSQRLDCTSPEIPLNASPAGDYHWSSLEVRNLQEAESTGYYYGIDSTACRNASGIVYIDTLSPVKQPFLLNPGPVKLCNGSSYRIATRGEDYYLWTDGTTYSRSIVADEPGVYYAFDYNGCDSIVSDTVKVEYFEFNQPEDLSLVTRDSFNIKLVTDYGKVRWYDAGKKLLAEVDTFNVDSLFRDTFFYYSLFAEPSVPVLYPGPAFEDSVAYLHNPDVITTCRLLLSEDFLIESFDVFLELSGKRRICIENVLSDETNCLYLDGESGINRVRLDTVLHSGSYRIYTDSSINMESLGQLSPDMYSIMPGAVDFPYELHPDARLFDSQELPGVLYFYNWVIRPYYETCESALAKFELNLDSIVDVSSIIKEDFYVYPNPGNGNYRIKGSSTVKSIDIYNAAGRYCDRIYPKANSFQMNRYEFPAGVYILKLNIGEGYVTTKLVQRP